MNSIQKSNLIVKIRLNLFQLPTGHVIGFGQRLAPGGLGYCFNCKAADCEHVVTVDEDWLAGRHSVLEDYQVLSTSGYHTAPAVTAPPFTLIPPSQADIDAVNDGNRPGVWRARTIEEMPSTWTRTVLQ